MKKAGFIFSGKYGRGYASCRKPGGGWSAPAGMRIEGGGFGLQAGGSATDVVMLVMSKKGMDGLLSSKFTLGGEASVAAGPVGRDATAQTDATMKADILSWSRSRGVFGGLSLQGGTLRPDDDANKALYGDKVTSRDILTGTINKPVASDTLTAWSIAGEWKVSNRCPEVFLVVLMCHRFRQQPCPSCRSRTRAVRRFVTRGR